MLLTQTIPIMNADAKPHGGMDRSADFSAESEADLMAYMALKSEDPDGARAAWEEFYRRHVEYLYSVCYKAFYGMLKGKAEVCDIVMETFMRAFEQAHHWNAGGLSEPDDLRRRSRAWLGRIAQRKVMDLLRNRETQTIAIDPSFLGDHEAPEPQEQHESKMVALIRESFTCLNKRELLVIRVTYQYYDIEQENQRLPDEVVRELAETLQTTPENLRQIRRRAMMKIKNYIKESEKGKGKKNES